MFRFMPTASGELHFGHVAAILAMNTVKYLELSDDPVSYVIDDAQVIGWNFYKPEISVSTKILNINKIDDSMEFLFPNIEDAGKFTDSKYIEYANKIISMDEVSCYWRENKYSMPKKNYETTYNGNPLFDALKCYYKTNLDGRIWNPYFLHEIVDKVLETKFQVVDANLYCPYSYAHDSHTITYSYYKFWKKIVNRKDYNIITIPRVKWEEGDISKSGQDHPFSVYPLDTCWERLESAFELSRYQIGIKLLNSDVSKPFVIRRPV